MNFKLHKALLIGWKTSMTSPLTKVFFSIIYIYIYMSYARHCPHLRHISVIKKRKKKQPLRFYGSLVTGKEQNYRDKYHLWLKKKLIRESLETLSKLGLEESIGTSVSHSIKQQIPWIWHIYFCSLCTVIILLIYLQHPYSTQRRALSWYTTLQTNIN